MFPLICGSSIHVLDTIPLSGLVITNAFPNLSSVSYLYSWCPLLNREPDFNVINYILFYYYSYLIYAFGVSFQISFSTSGSHILLHYLLWTLCLCHHRKLEAFWRLRCMWCLVLFFSNNDSVFLMPPLNNFSSSQCCVLSPFYQILSSHLCTGLFLSSKLKFISIFIWFCVKKTH